VAERRITRGVAAVLVALLAACASQVAPPPQAGKPEPAGFPAAHYRQLLAQGKPVFRVDPARSLLLVVVRRGGALAQFGHDHVVASHDVAGYIAPDDGRADLYVPLDAMAVDEPALRAGAGFDTQPSAADIAGTRRNMLDKVLETSRHPYALIAVSDNGAGAAAHQPTVALTLHGVTRRVEAASHLERSAGEITVTGALAIDQSRFGIEPFSILGGAISVQDRVNITFRLRARRVE
jgi:YceI-like domain